EVLSTAKKRIRRSLEKRSARFGQVFQCSSAIQSLIAPQTWGQNHPQTMDFIGHAAHNESIQPGISIKSNAGVRCHSLYWSQI
ncbi:uncharacterized protein METZ01_LOCUS133407, partial [marine metagenome]